MFRMPSGIPDLPEKFDTSHKILFYCSKTELYLKPCQTSMIGVFCENRERLKANTVFAQSSFIEV